VLVLLRLVPIVTVIASITVNVTPVQQEDVPIHLIATVIAAHVIVTVEAIVTALTIVTVTAVPIPSATATVRRTGIATVRS
jgi:hypothetical protein